MRASDVGTGPNAATGFTATRLAPVYYAKSHEWVDIEGDKATLGISDFAQKELGDVVYVDLPEVVHCLSRSGGYAWG